MLLLSWLRETTGNPGSSHWYLSRLVFRTRLFHPPRCGQCSGTVFHEILGNPKQPKHWTLTNQMDLDHAGFFPGPEHISKSATPPTGHASAFHPRLNCSCHEHHQHHAPPMGDHALHTTRRTEILWIRIQTNPSYWWHNVFNWIFLVITKRFVWSFLCLLEDQNSQQPSFQRATGVYRFHLSGTDDHLFAIDKSGGPNCQPIPRRRWNLSSVS